MEAKGATASLRPPIRIGLIGLGRAALLDHLPVLRTLPDLYKVVAVCDLLKERRDQVERVIPDVHTYRQPEDMLDDPELDLVDVCLPSADHMKTALAALDRGLWTLVETPLAFTQEDANRLRAASTKQRGKLFPYAPGLFAPDFRLALAALDNPALGDVYDVRIRRQDWVRRDDWQSVKRLGGGSVFTYGPDAVLQAVALLRAQPAQLWSELKRVAALGDAEDFAHIVLKGRGDVTVDIEINGGHLARPEPSFTVRGSRGTFTVEPGARAGVLHAIDPACTLPRRRSSVRTPDLGDPHEKLPLVDIPVTLPPDAEKGPAAFWRALYATIRTAAPFPVEADAWVDMTRYLQIVKQSSPFAK